jgi:hypothetical protein
MEGVISPAFARALEGGRDRFNARFAQALRAYSRIDGAAFLDLLRCRVDPVLRKVEDSRVPALTEVLYDATLELLGKGLIGPAARHPEYERRWGELLAGTVRLVESSSVELVGMLSNALYNLLTTPCCRPAEWCRVMVELSVDCARDTLLKLGQLAAWRFGMAHYRTAALGLARTLPPRPVTRILLGPSGDVKDLHGVVDRLEPDPWHHPLEPNTIRGPRLVAEVGGFRGNGGAFIRPPVVSACDGHLFADDGESTWLVTADAFGAVLHRTHPPQAADKPNGRWKLDKAGTVTGQRGKAKLPLLANASSSAGTERTLAVALPHSHRVFLVSEEVA